MSIFEKDFLSRVKSRGAPVKTQEPPTHSDNVPKQKSATLEELVKPARAAGHTGPLVVGPPRSSLKSSWRDDAKWLEENCPEEFGQPPKAHSPEAPGEVSTGLRTSLPAVVAPGPSQNALESAQSRAQVPPAPPIPPLPTSWWQSLMYGSPDALLSAGDATRAVHLIAERLRKDSSEVQFSEAVRVGALRKILDERFGAGESWQAMHGLWRSAPTSLGASEPNIDQSRCTPGVWDCPRSMPSWRRDFHQEVSDDRRLLESMGGWADG